MCDPIQCQNLTLFQFQIDILVRVEGNNQILGQKQYMPDLTDVLTTYEVQSLT